VGRKARRALGRGVRRALTQSGALCWGAVPARAPTALPSRPVDRTAPYWPPRRLIKIMPFFTDFDFSKFGQKVPKIEFEKK